MMALVRQISGITQPLFIIRPSVLYINAFGKSRREPETFSPNISQHRLSLK